MKFMTNTSHHAQFIIFFIIQTVMFYFIFVILNINISYKPQYGILPRHNCSGAEKGKVILLWTWPFGEKFSFDECRHTAESSDCVFSDNRSLYQSADAVVIHHRDVSVSRDLLPPIPRPVRQYWVWFNLEAPSHSPNLAMMDNLINLTMSYKVDSDIFTPYGWLEKLDTPQNFIISVKSKLVAWVVSNWNRTYDRFQYYEKLKKYMDVDIYGRHHMPLSRQNLSHVLSKYKFYLAFENSKDKDYITEKLWNNAFMSGTVPIVMGPTRKNYERFIPKDSFIHVDDFSSPQDLANYILELDRDDKRYQAYFSWRTWFQPVRVHTWATYYCKVCNALKVIQSYRSMPNLPEWFSK
ncbi:3-galactosyl-N-acetylglucosaminide 4-alpha-L-fucosyltransferase FUT3-like [Spea bombifrons]|uniref:3-galactosyl-N-acetylglucosaminide 4-alpha-L-fucosyltransferase FUT3-like n=1 Tax=Spea bombifrons TaxID=233779 RepID=UPI00234A5416|nr:3-galactosyl-N-acetylglucosaminide 4-alpha-L-fucosyltransferase FUT3-like [Spea bombifrons]